MLVSARERSLSLVSVVVSVAGLYRWSLSGIAVVGVSTVVASDTPTSVASGTIAAVASDARTATVL